MTLGAVWSSQSEVTHRRQPGAWLSGQAHENKDPCYVLCARRRTGRQFTPGMPNVRRHPRIQSPAFRGEVVGEDDHLSIRVDCRVCIEVREVVVLRSRPDDPEVVDESVRERQIDERVSLA